MSNKTVGKTKKTDEKLRKFPEKVYVYYGEDDEDYWICDSDLAMTEKDTDIAIYELVGVGRKKVTVEFISDL